MWFVLKYCVKFKFNLESPRSLKDVVIGFRVIRALRKVDRVYSVHGLQHVAATIGG